MMQSSPLNLRRAIIWLGGVGSDDDLKHHRGLGAIGKDDDRAAAETRFDRPRRAGRTQSRFGKFASGASRAASANGSAR